MAPVPTVLWTYWHGGEACAPPLVRGCLARMRATHEAAGWRVHCLGDGDDLPTIVGRYPPSNFDRLSPTQRSDWLRLALLHRYGGCWLDATVVAVRSLAECFDLSGDAADVQAYTYPGTDHTTSGPLMEAWAMACAPGNRFMGIWLAEWERAIVRVRDVLRAGRVTSRRWPGGVLRGLAPCPGRAAPPPRRRPPPVPGPVRGLVCGCAGALPRGAYAVAVQRVSARPLRPGDRSHIGCAKRRSPATALHHRCAWVGDRIVDALCDWDADVVRRLCPVLLKLRGVDRRRLDDRTRGGCYRTSSVLVVLLGLPPPLRSHIFAWCGIGAALAVLLLVHRQGVA